MWRLPSGWAAHQARLWRCACIRTPRLRLARICITLAVIRTVFLFISSCFAVLRCIPRLTVPLTSWLRELWYSGPKPLVYRLAMMYTRLQSLRYRCTTYRTAAEPVTTDVIDSSLEDTHNEGRMSRLVTSSVSQVIVYKNM